MADTGRFDYLDGVRAVAIGAVLSLHWLSWYSPLFHGGSVGVDVFFVLSGFIITTMLWRSPVPSSLVAAWAAFLRRRMVRLYPALLGLVVVTVGLYAVTPGAPVDTARVLSRGLLALGQASAPWAASAGDGIWTPSLNPFGQTWSLAVEWYFYLLWPVVVLRARMRGVRPDRLANASLVSAVALYALALPLGDAWFYFGPVSRFAEILVGGALALAFQEGAPRRPWRHASPAATVSLAAICGYTLLAPHASSPAYRWVGVPLTVLATVTLIYAGCRNTTGGVHRLLGHRWVAAVGRSSYSLYLWHMVPGLVMAQLSQPASKPLRGLVALAAVVGLTLASHHLLERPFLRGHRRALRPLPPPAEDAPVLQRGDEVRG